MALTRFYELAGCLFFLKMTGVEGDILYSCFSMSEKPLPQIKKDTPRWSVVLF